MPVLSTMRSKTPAVLRAFSGLQKPDLLPSMHLYRDVRCLQSLCSFGGSIFGHDLSNKQSIPICSIRKQNFFSKSGESLDEESGLPLHHPEKGTLVYTGRMSKVVRNLKILSLSTSLVSAGCQPLILAAAKDDFIVTAGILSTMCIVVFSTPVILHMVTRKYVTDIYFNEDTKTFTLASKSFFIRRKEFQFKADEAKVALDGGLFVTHKVKGKPYFIEYTDFRSKDIYMHMVGYDKPLEDTIQDPNKHLKRKKFGLFEDDEPVNQPSSATTLRGNMSMLDDDDDDVHKTQVKKK